MQPEKFAPLKLGLHQSWLIGRKSEVFLVGCFLARKGTQGSKKLTNNDSFADS